MRPSDRLVPLPETLSVLHTLSAIPKAHPDLAGLIQDLADRVVDATPECLGLSVGYREHGLTFSYIRTAERISILDAVQYADDGPCVQAARVGQEFVIGDVLDEHRWQLFAQASAAAGVRSTLSLPIRRDADVIGSVNFYGTTTDAFAGEEQQLARLFGGWVQDAVRNADLGMTTMDEARRAPTLVAEREVVEQAIGALAARRGISAEEAAQRLVDAAARAGAQVIEVARAIVLGRGTP